MSWTLISFGSSRPEVIVLNHHQSLRFYVCARTQNYLRACTVKRLAQDLHQVLGLNGFKSPDRSRCRGKEVVTTERWGTPVVTVPFLRRSRRQDDRSQWDSRCLGSTNCGPSETGGTVSHLVRRFLVSILKGSNKTQVQGFGHLWTSLFG